MNDGLPPPDQPFTIESLDRWPLGAYKRELEDGVALWYGPWDERDVLIAQRAFPGRSVALDEVGNLRVGPGDPGRR